jgi:outer membrane protein
VVLYSLIYASSVVAAEKYGVVNIQEVVVKCDLGKKEMATLKQMAMEKNKPIQEKDKELRKLREDLEKQKTVISAAAYSKKEAAFQRKARDLQIMANDAGNELKRKEQEILSKILPDVRKVIANIGEKENYTYIIDSTVIAHFSKEVDLTQRVIEEMNKTYKPQNQKRKRSKAKK